MCSCAGVDSEAATRAAESLDEMGIHPWIGSLPETRWLEQVEAASEEGEASIS